ncbi:MAG TPA: hypothetical protein VI278_14105, partial [Nitrososphaeraceae archaeon]
EGTPTNLQEKIRYIERSIFVLVIEELKEFADGNFEGKKPEWIVSSTNPIPNTDNDVQTKDYFAYY